MYLRKGIMEACFIGCLLLVVCLPFVAPSNTACGTQNFPCDSGDQCVEKSKWCDDKKDCKDGSDEGYCNKIRWYTTSDPNDCTKMEETHIVCGSGICVPITARCDEQEDCDDGIDEKFCESAEIDLDKTTTKSTESPNIVEEDTFTFTFEDDYVIKDETTTSPTSLTEASSSTARHYERDEEPTTTIPDIRDVYSSGFNNYFPASTSYYDKRMKEASSEIKSSPTFPKAVPTSHYLGTRTTASTTPKAHRRNLTRPTYSSTTYGRVPERRPPSRPQSRQSTEQRQMTNPRANHYLPSINHYQFPTHPHRPPPSNHYPSPSNNHHPHYNYQPLSNPYQAPSNQYRPPYNQHQPSSNQYHRPSNQRQPNPYQPHNNLHQQPHRDRQQHHNEQRRPLNGEPDVRHHYFKTYGAAPSAKKFFRFAKDYAALHGRDTARPVREGVRWLLRQRSDTHDWDTSRAVIALALANNSFVDVGSEEEIIKKRFMVQLGTDLLRNNTENFDINRMVMAINGLMAVCEDPTDFHGMDLTEVLRYKIGEKKNAHLNPFVFLSLCLAGKGLSYAELENLMKMMHSVKRNERDKDMKIAALMAFSCYVHQSASGDSNFRDILRRAVTDLLTQMGGEGDFGSVYSTALAAQALMSTNESSEWDAGKTMSFLQRQQREDGSFGDLLATYLALPPLSGHTLLHLRNKQCPSLKREGLTAAEILEMPGPRQYVSYSLYFGYPITNSLSQYLPVPRGIHFLDVMRVAEYRDQNFRFSLDDHHFNRVYSVSGLPNDPEMGLSWHLYVKPGSSPYPHEPDSRERFSGDVRTLLPNSDEYLIFWYHSDDLRI